jgi:multidrug resistance efflux pump
MAVVPLGQEDIWITANYKETQLERVKPGQKVKIKVDTYPGKVFYGKVDSVTAGTGSVFSLLPPENATGNYVKVVQRIPVKIVLEPEAGVLRKAVILADTASRTCEGIVLPNNASWKARVMPSRWSQVSTT